MRATAEISLGIGGLLVLQALGAFASIGLLGRVSPAIQHILKDNEYSMEAVEDMLAELARPPERTDWVRFDAALDRARGNITEEPETPLITAIAAARSELQSTGQGRDRLVDALVALSDVNRTSMHRADQSAQLIGWGGAWTATGVGFLGLLLGVSVLRRTLHQLARPVEHLDAALQAVRQGDTLRRCSEDDGPGEIRRIAANMNWLLDRDTVAPAAPATERLTLLAALDALPMPIAVFEPTGALQALNLPGEVHRGAEGPLEALSAAVTRLARPEPEDASLPEGWTLTPSSDRSLWVAVGRPTS